MKRLRRVSNEKAGKTDKLKLKWTGNCLLKYSLQILMLFFTLQAVYSTSENIGFVIKQSNYNGEGKSNDKWRKNRAINVDGGSTGEIRFLIACLINQPLMEIN